MASNYGEKRGFARVSEDHARAIRSCVSEGDAERRANESDAFAEGKRLRRRPGRHRREGRAHARECEAAIIADLS